MDETRINVKREFYRADTEIAGIALASMSFLAAFFFFRIVEWAVWEINTAGKVAIIMLCIYILANLINYAALQYVLKFKRLEAVLKKKVIQLDIVVISSLAATVGAVWLSAVWLSQMT